MIEPGNKFIRFSKRGTSVIGIVEWVNYDSYYTVSHEHKVIYMTPMLRSTNGVMYYLNECYEVTEDLVDGKWEKYIANPKLFRANRDLSKIPKEEWEKLKDLDSK